MYCSKPCRAWTSKPSNVTPLSVVMLITPEIAPGPNVVEPGPRITSTQLMSRSNGRSRSESAPTRNRWFITLPLTRNRYLSSRSLTMPRMPTCGENEW